MLCRGRQSRDGRGAYCCAVPRAYATLMWAFHLVSSSCTCELSWVLFSYKCFMSVLLQIVTRYKRHWPPFAEQVLSRISNESVFDFSAACQDWVSRWSHQQHKLSFVFSVWFQPQWHLPQWPTGKSNCCCCLNCLNAGILSPRCSLEAKKMWPWSFQCCGLGLVQFGLQSSSTYFWHLISSSVVMSDET